MSPNEFRSCTRRSFLKKSIAAGAAATGFTIIKPELVRGAGKERLRAGLVGCGGRGTGAAVDLLTADPNVELVSIGDVFEDKLQKSLANLHDPKFLMDASPKRVAEFTGQPLDELVDSVRKRVQVSPDQCFIGFDAYRKVLAEVRGLERASERRAPPFGILGRVRVNRLVLAAVDAGIRLAVAVEVEASNGDGTVHRRLEDRGGHLFPSPPDDAGRSDRNGLDLHQPRSRSIGT